VQRIERGFGWGKDHVANVIGPMHASTAGRPYRFGMDAAEIAMARVPNAICMGVTGLAG
jgi:hypothetical protein